MMSSLSLEVCNFSLDFTWPHTWAMKSPFPLPLYPNFVLIFQPQEAGRNRLPVQLERLPVPLSWAVRCPYSWERPRPLVRPWSRLPPAPPCPWELALPA